MSESGLNTTVKSGAGVIVIDGDEVVASSLWLWNCLRVEGLP